MISPQVSKEVMDLPEDERLELARRLIESVVSERELEGAIAEGVKRIEDVASGRVVPLTEAEFCEQMR